MLTKKEPSPSVKPVMNHGCRELPIIAFGAGGIATSLIKLRNKYLRISAHHEEIKLHCLQDQI
jgi:hypothetical protein